MKKDRVQKGGSAIIVLNCFRMVFIVGIAFMLALFTAPLIDLETDQGNVWAAGKSENGGEHGKGAGGKGTHGKNEVMGQQGGASDVKSKILSADEGEDDSDRPEWAQGNRELNPHAQGGGQPAGAGTTKGDMYGDLWVILRDAEGVPILIEIAGEYHVQPIAFDADGNMVLDDDGNPVLIPLDEEGEIPAGSEYMPLEVEFGRLSIGRAPDKVTAHALDEALSKLTVAGAVITQDLSGRLLVDGAAIDSPLENLALYIALMNDDPAVLAVADSLGTDKLTLAASLLAAAADKTGSISLDVVAYENVILGIAAMTPEDYVVYSDFDYSRDDTCAGDISYYFLPEGAEVPVLVTEPIIDAVFGGDSYTSDDGEGLTDFVQAADDALQIIEFVHTQVHE